MALAREMQNAQDAALMDAWKNGGEYLGKGVTDEQVMAHWNERLNNVAKDDPLYSQYKSTVMQLDYSISESKAAVLYAQGKLSDQGMAKFYLDWAKKVPKDSEFYRTLQKDGARFLAAASSRAASGAAAAKTKAYNDAQANLAKGKAVGDLLDWALTGIANVNGLLGSGDTKGLVNLSDPAHLVGLIQNINADPSRVLFQATDASGNAQVWTGQDLMNAIAKVDPGFSGAASAAAGATGRQFEGTRATVVGGLTLDYIQRALQTSHETSLSQAALATANGKSPAAFIKAAGAVTETIREVGAWGVAPTYNQIIAERDHVLNDPTTTGEDKRSAALAAATALSKLANGNGIDLRTATILHNEALANAGDTSQATVSTYGEDYLGTQTQAPQSQGSAATGSPTTLTANGRVSALVEQLNTEHDAMTQQPAAYTYAYGSRDAKTGVFTFDPTGKEVGVVSRVDVARQATTYATVPIPQADGSPLMVTVVGPPIKVTARDEFGQSVPAGTATGSAVNDVANPTLGSVYTYTSHGQTVRMYQLPDGEGGTFFTTVPPWATGASETDNKDGSVTVDVSSLVASGKGVHRYTTVSGTPGKFETPATGPGTTTYFNPIEAAISSIRDVAGRDQTVDFDVPIIAALSISEDTLGMATKIANDPTLRAALLSQETAAARGDPAKLAEIQNHDTLILTGVLSPGESTQPVYSINATGNLVTRQTAVLPGRPIPADSNFAALAATMQVNPLTGKPNAYLNAMPTNTRAVPVGPANIAPQAGAAAVTPQTLKLPIVPDGFGGHAGGIAPLTLPQVPVGPANIAGSAGKYGLVTAPAPITPIGPANIEPLPVAPAPAIEPWASPTAVRPKVTSVGQPLRL